MPDFAVLIWKEVVNQFLKERSAEATWFIAIALFIALWPDLNPLKQWESFQLLQWAQVHNALLCRTSEVSLEGLKTTYHPAPSKYILNQLRLAYIYTPGKEWNWTYRTVGILPLRFPT